MLERKVIFNLLRTHRLPYVLDRYSGAFLPLTEEKYAELLEVQNNSLLPEDSPLIREYQKLGLFLPNAIQRIEHPATALLEQYINTRTKQLILQLTQRCNLNCSYCAFSGRYAKNRVHANKSMSIEVAKAAIDLFLTHNRDLAVVLIAFYGGEPLLEFDLLKECVEYAKNAVEGKTISYSITTNGTLLTDSVADYLADNNFTLSISLDGSKEEHDINRKYVNGAGSFDDVINNIKKLKHRHPEFDKKIQILTTINPYMDLSCALEFFGTEELFEDKQIIFNQMNEINLNQSLDYDDEFFMVRNYEYIKMLMSMIGKLSSEHVSPLFARTRNDIEKRQRQIHRHSALPRIVHHGGPCIPGVRRIFVRTDGALYPCERVSEIVDYYNIGTVSGGLDLAKMEEILNIGKLTDAECIDCWCIRQCSVCAGQIEFDTVPTRDDKRRCCPANERKALFDLHELCVLNEFGLVDERKG